MRARRDKRGQGVGCTGDILICCMSHVVCHILHIACCTQHAACCTWSGDVCFDMSTAAGNVKAAMATGKPLKKDPRHAEHIYTRVMCVCTCVYAVTQARAHVHELMRHTGACA